MDQSHIVWDDRILCLIIYTYYYIYIYKNINHKAKLMITVYPIHYRQIIATGTEKRVILCFYLPMQFPPQDVSELLDATL